MPYKRILFALVFTAFTDSLAEELLQPLIVVLLEFQDVSTFLIGLTTAAGELGVLLSAPFIPTIVRILKPVAYVRVSLLVLCFGIFLFPLFPHVAVWIGLDFAFGIVTCGYLILSDTLVNAAAEDHYRGRLLSLYLVADSLGAILGPFVLSFVGFEGFTPFAVASVIMFIGITPWLFLRGLRAPDLHDGPPPPLLAVIRTAPLVLLVAVVAAFLDDVPGSLFPVFSLEYGLSESTAVLMLSVLAVGTVLFQLPAGWAADALDRRVFLALVAAATAAGALALPGVMGGGPALWTLILLLGGLFNAFHAVGLALLGDRATPATLAQLNAAATMFASVASFVGPPATGLAMDIAGPRAFVWAIGSISALVLVAALIDARRNPARSRARVP